jgi:hypothetical protein
MISLVLLALASAEAPEAPKAKPGVYQAQFAPLRKSERHYAAVGPVGPYYPQSAIMARQNWVAVLTCSLGEAGALKRCKPVREEPKGFDFGVAARVMADRRHITVSEALKQDEPIYVVVPFVIGAPAVVEP